MGGDVSHGSGIHLKQKVSTLYDGIKIREGVMKATLSTPHQQASYGLVP